MEKSGIDQYLFQFYDFHVLLKEKMDYLIHYTRYTTTTNKKYFLTPI